jgi:uncharacterized protein YecT (DUF1311 family)
VIKKTILAMLFVTAGSAVFASETGLTKQFSACMGKAGGIDDAMHECIGAEYKKQDARLNKNYRTLFASLTAERKKQLQTAQRLWIQYRDANCNFYADPDGGTQALIGAADCSMQATAARATELENFIQ